MFVRHYLEVPFGFEQTAEALLRAPEEWIPGAARSAGRSGDALLAEVGFDWNGSRMAKEVQIEIGPPARLQARTLLPMTWRATGSQGLFPMLDGDLEVARLGPTRTQVAVSAQYRPPLRSVGRAMDRALLHRIAEATVKDFTERVGKQIEDMISIDSRTP